MKPFESKATYYVREKLKEMKTYSPPVSDEEWNEYLDICKQWADEENHPY